MERIIIIASPEVDVSDAVKLLQSDDVEVSVVAPSPANFLQFALGMIPDHPNDGKINTENDNLESTDIEPEPEEELESDKKSESDIADDKTGDEDNSIGECTVNGERVRAFITSGTPYIEVSNLSTGLRNNFSINESSFSFWNTTNEQNLHHSFYISFGGNMTSVLLEVKTSTLSTPRVFLSADQVAKLK